MKKSSIKKDQQNVPIKPKKLMITQAYLDNKSPLASMKSQGNLDISRTRGPNMRSGNSHTKLLNRVKSE